MRNHLTGSVCSVTDLTDTDKETMYLLMEEFYDNTNRTTFLNDLHQKDWCITLRGADGNILGFSTQKLLSISIDGKPVHGIFSGDTIIHKDHWGSMELFRVFARHFFSIAENYPRLYWFLISKGYKTYKILPTFFQEFYPDYRKEIPPDIATIMDTFGTACFPGCYSPADRVIHYHTVKDRLKEGVADITAAQLKDPNIAFFLKANPGYQQGDDMVCLAILDKKNLIPKSHKILFSGADA